MATRFYLPASGTPPLAALAKNAAWELETGLVRLPTKTTKSNTALATSTRTWAAATTQQWCWYQFQSEQLSAAYNWTTSDTVSMVLGLLAETTTSGDTTLCFCIRVVSQDGTTIRGIVGAVQAASGTEYAVIASAATRIFSAVTTGATTFSSQIGDRIIIELGVHGVTPALENIQFRVGDPTATADFALTTALTTDLCSWVELSRTVAFGVAVAIIEAATGADSPSAIFTGLSAIVEAATLIDSPSVAYITLSGIIEVSNAGENSDAGLLFAATIVESIDIVDGTDSILLLPVILTETNNLSETSSAIILTDGMIIEPTNIIDENSSISVQVVVISEEASIVEQSESIIITISIITEIGICSDLLSSVLTILSDITEGSSLTDILSGLSLLSSVIAEPLTAIEILDSEISEGGTIYPVSIDESDIIVESCNATVVQSASIIEDLTVSDFNLGTYIITDSISELISAIDVVSALTMGVCQIIEVVELQEVSNGAFLSVIITASITEDSIANDNNYVSIIYIVIYFRKMTVLYETLSENIMTGEFKVNKIKSKVRNNEVFES